MGMQTHLDQRDKNNLMGKNSKMLNSIIMGKYPATYKLAQYIQMNNLHEKADKKTKVAISNLANKVVNGGQLRGVLDSGMKCWNHMSNIIKGMYCKACDGDSSYAIFGAKADK